MSYLTYHRLRRDQWKEFKEFPHKAVHVWRNSEQYHYALYKEVPLLIFEVSDDHTNIRFMPESEWPTP